MLIKKLIEYDPEDEEKCEVIVRCPECQRDIRMGMETTVCPLCMAELGDGFNYAVWDEYASVSPKLIEEFTGGTTMPGTTESEVVNVFAKSGEAVETGSGSSDGTVFSAADGTQGNSENSVHASTDAGVGNAGPADGVDGDQQSSEKGKGKGRGKKSAAGKPDPEQMENDVHTKTNPETLTGAPDAGTIASDLFSGHGTSDPGANAAGTPDPGAEPVKKPRKKREKKAETPAPATKALVVRKKNLPDKFANGEPSFRYINGRPLDRRNHEGVVVIATKILPLKSKKRNGYNVTFGVAYCSPGDVFDREKGRALALKRLNDEKYAATVFVTKINAIKINIAIYGHIIATGNHPHWAKWLILTELGASAGTEVIRHGDKVRNRLASARKAQVNEIKGHRQEDIDAVTKGIEPAFSASSLRRLIDPAMSSRIDTIMTGKGLSFADHVRKVLREIVPPRAWCGDIYHPSKGHVERHCLFYLGDPT